jgi:metal-dependent amidase/aminoacylase/carboxypeptidase family protein
LPGRLEHASKVTGSEDFSLHKNLVQVLFVFVGVTPPHRDAANVAPNHSPRFYADECALVTDVRLLAKLACDSLETPRVVAATDTVAADQHKR